MVKTAAGVTGHSYFEKGGVVNQDSVGPAAFDLLLKHLANWKQSEPSATLVAKYQASGLVTSGYVGVVTLFDEGKTKQFLLSFEDLMAIDVESARMSGDPGPFARLLAAAEASATEDELRNRLNAQAEREILVSAAQDSMSDADALDSLTRESANQLDRDGRSLLMVAAESGNVTAIAKLINLGAEIELQGKIHAGPYTALGMAARAGQKEAVQELLRHGARVTHDATSLRPYSEALFEAAHAGHIAIVQLLVEYGADPKGLNQNDYSVLNYLFFSGHPPSREVVELVLSFGADIDEPNRFGETPLMNAVEMGDAGHALIALLIERGANVNAVTPKGWSVLKAAQQKGEHSKKIVALLRENGAELSPQKKPLSAAINTDTRESERMIIHDVGTDDLSVQIGAASQSEIVIAVFCADWAKPCSQYRKIIEKIPRVSGARLVWVTSRNGDADAPLLAPYRVMAFPHTVIVSRDKVASDRSGVLTPDEFDNMVQRARKRLER